MPAPERQIYVVGHRNPDADSVCSAIAYARLQNALGRSNVRPARAGAVDAETAFALARFAVDEPELLTDGAGRDLILVDHNEVGQAVPNIRQANVLEVWEHHRIGDLRTAQPILFRCEPVGATATLIAEQYFAESVSPPPAIAGLLLAAILSDTVCLRSPTTTMRDRRMVERLASMASVDAGELGEQLLHLRSAAAEQRSASEIVRGDFKVFDLAGARVGIGQVAVTRPDALANRKDELGRELRDVRVASGLVQVILMITDVEAGASDLWFEGERQDVFEDAFGPLVDRAVHLDGCMSRKKQIVPPLQAAFEADGSGKSSALRSGNSATSRKREEA